MSFYLTLKNNHYEGGTAIILIAQEMNKVPKKGSVNRIGTGNPD